MITLKHDDQWHQDLMTKGGFHQVYDNDIPSRARLTCPPGLSIKAVKDHLGKQRFGVFAKKIVQVRTRYGPLQAPVKSRVRCEPIATPQQPVPQPSCMTHQVQDVQKSIPNQQTSVQEQQRSIQEVAMDRNNVEHQDIVQQALGIVKVDPQQMMSEEHTPGSYGDVVTTIANSLSESMNLSTTLPSGDMNVPGQFGSGHIGELGLTVPIENSSVTEGIPVTLTPLQAHNLLGHINANHFPSVTTSAVLNNQQEIIPIVSTETQMLPQASENQSVENTVKNVLQSVVSELVSEPTPEPVEDRPEQIDPADQPFEIKVFHEDGIEELLDLSDEDKCNWMMFVRPARTAAEQNVVVYQFENRIYFASTKPIPSNTEIRVWYEADYAAVIKKKLLPDGEGPASAAGYPPKWACSVCLEGFSTFNELEAHVCPGEPVSENKRLRGRPRKGRPRKYVKPSKTWRARLEKSRLPPRKRGRPPKLKGSIITIPKPPKEAVVNLPIPESHPMEMLDQAHELPPPEDKDDDDVSALELLDEVLGEDDDDDVIPIPTHRRRGRKKRLPGAPRAPRIPKREPMQCPHCEETFTKEALFVIHVAEHTGIKPYICEVPECQKGFMSKFKLERHRLIHTCPRSHKCLYCDKCFNRKDHLKNHMITHDPNKKRWVCEECGKEYSYNFSYRTHKAFHDADAGRTTECGICHKVYDTKDELLYHLKVHSGARSVKNCTEKTHACEDCGKTFYTRKDVRRHMITHTKRKDFLCQYCPQRFGRKDHLTRHLRSSHSGDNNNRVRAPRAERKEKPFTSNISIMGSLQLPRDDPNVLVTSQPSLVNYQQLQAFAEIPVPLHMFENTSGNQSVITMANLSGLQQQQQPQQQQQQQQSLQVIQGVQHAVIPNQMQPVAENRQSVDTAVVRYPTQHIESPTPNDYRSIQANQTHSGGIQTYIPLAAQQPQQQVQQQHLQGKNDANIDLTRTNGVLQVEYQVPNTRNDQSTRPAIIQASNTTPREGSQTFSTLLGYMETLRFLENLPTNAQTSVISQLHMHQDGQQLPTMVPMQTSLAYSVATTTNNQTHQLIPVEMQTKRMTVTQAQHNAYQQGS